MRVDVADDACTERTSGRGPRGADRRMGGRGTDGAQQVRTGGRGRKSRGRADWADRQTSSLVDGRTGGRGGGLGFKIHIPRGPFHSWAPSPLASSERKCTGCLGV